MPNRTDTVFKVGDPVFVRALNADGIIIERLSTGLYRVALKSINVTVRASELSFRECAVPPQPAHRTSVVTTDSRPSRVKQTIDLHGLSVDQACRALEQWLNSLIVSGGKQGKVIHGLGSGKVQRAAHETLSRYTAVRAFRINDLNPGETDVYLD